MITWNVKIVQADKTVLRDAVNTATTAKNHPKVYEWKAEVERVITQANTVLNDTNATTSDITQAISSLNQAISRLRRDETAPEIYWVSEKEIFVWDEFSPLAWVTATDNIDWNISLNDSNIIENTVNKNVVWTYRVKYKVVDSKWNEKIVERVVKVKEIDKTNLRNELTNAENKLRSHSFILSETDRRNLENAVARARTVLSDPNARIANISTAINDLRNIVWSWHNASSPSNTSLSLKNDNRVTTWTENNSSSREETWWEKKIEKKEDKKEEKVENIKKEEKTNQKLLEELKNKLKEENKELKIREINGEPKVYSVLKRYDNCGMIWNILWDYNSDYKLTFKDVTEKNYLDELQRLEKVWIIKWTKPWIFEPNRWITRSEFLAIVLQVHCYDVSHKPESLPFYDVDLDSWQARVIKVWTELWIIKWYEKDKKWTPFRPDREISKIEAFWIMMKMREIEILENYKDKYTDKKANWQDKPLSAGEYLWILKPEETNYKFHPDSYLNRDEMVKMIIDIIKLY